MTTPFLFCFGLGYSAQALAKLLLPLGWRVAGTCRSAQKAVQLRQQSIEVCVMDNVHALQPPYPFADASHILHSIPPGEESDPVFHLHEAIATHAALEWFGYLSTTGVYGDHQGEWIDETTPPNPGQERSRQRLNAEKHWLATNLPVHLFRLSGIYGPGRSVLDGIRQGTARRIDAPGQVFSRIHVADIAAILLASIKKPFPRRIYNCADDVPALQSDVVAYGCTLLGVPPPPEIPLAEAALSPMARSFYTECRRVRNSRIKEELGVILQYPDYRLGLQAILEAERINKNG
ncbi:MAG: SDR family oxidoreductase [Hyphomicrobiales bacterium]|nr:SDR family oxidoreductase [Hyphomicrobiales bacterium]